MPPLPKRDTKTLMPAVKEGTPLPNLAIPTGIVGVFDTMEMPDPVSRLIKYSDKAKNAATVRAALPGITDGRYYLQWEGRYTYPQGVWFFSAVQFWTDIALEGKDMKVKEVVKVEPSFAEQQRLKPDVRAFALVDVGDTFVPCLAQFRGPAAGFARALVDAIKERAGGNWVGVYAKFTDQPRTSKRNGLPYVENKADIIDLKPDMSTRLSGWLGEVENQQTLETMSQLYQNSLGELTKLLKK